MPSSLLILEKDNPLKITCHVLEFHKLLFFLFHAFKRTTWRESPLKLDIFSKRHAVNVLDLKKKPNKRSQHFLADMTVVSFLAIGGQYFQE